MTDYNHVVLCGRITREVTVRYTPRGTSIARIRLSVTRRFTPRGETKYKVEQGFFTVEFWGRSGETAFQFLNVGNTIIVDGHLKQEVWRNKEGETNHRTYVVGHTWQQIDRCLKGQ